MLVFGGVICPQKKHASFLLYEDQWCLVENFETTTSCFLQRARGRNETSEKMRTNDQTTWWSCDVTKWNCFLWMRERGKVLVGSSHPRKSCRIYVWYSTSRSYKSIYNLQLVGAHLVHNMYQKRQPTGGKYASPCARKWKHKQKSSSFPKEVCVSKKVRQLSMWKTNWRTVYSYKDSGGNDDTLQ